jgi:hypothetical protein
MPWLPFAKILTLPNLWTESQILVEPITAASMRVSSVCAEASEIVSLHRIKERRLTIPVSKISETAARAAGA